MTKKITFLEQKDGGGPQVKNECRGCIVRGSAMARPLVMGLNNGEGGDKGVELEDWLLRIRAAFSLGTWEPGSHEMFKLKRNFW